MGEEGSVASFDGVGLSGEEKGEGASSGADVDGLPEAVKDENGPIEHVGGIRRGGLHVPRTLWGALDSDG